MPACSPIPGAPKQPVDIYPAELQRKDTFCKDLGARKDARQLMGHFNVVRGSGEELTAVPYHGRVQRQDERDREGAERGRRQRAKDKSEKALVAYLEAAAAELHLRTTGFPPTRRGRR